MKKIFYIFLLYFIPFNSVSCEIVDIPDYLQKNMPVKYMMTEVPRGYIVSVNSEYFFSNLSEKIKSGSLDNLNKIGYILKNIDKVCVIEGHSNYDNFENIPYKSNWELSLARANSITIYFLRCLKFSQNKIFSIGYGEIIPIMDKHNNSFNDRIDFVIIDY